MSWKSSFAAFPALVLFLPDFFFFCKGFCTQMAHGYFARPGYEIFHAASLRQPDTNSWNQNKNKDLTKNLLFLTFTLLGILSAHQVAARCRSCKLLTLVNILIRSTLCHAAPWNTSRPTLNGANDCRPRPIRSLNWLEKRFGHTTFTCPFTWSPKSTPFGYTCSASRLWVWACLASSSTASCSNGARIQQARFCTAPNSWQEGRFKLGG